MLKPLNPKAWQRQPSMLAVYALLALTVLVIIASLYPFSGWRDLGIAPFAYLQVAWPERLYVYDVIVNVVGYMPLGLLAVFVLHPRLKPYYSVPLALVYCGGLSAMLEAVQSYLPSRVSSKVDLAANLAGGALGALIGAFMAAPVLDRGKLREWRRQWFNRDASHGLVLVALWLSAHIYPQQFAFGVGTLPTSMIAGLLPDSWAALIDLPAFSAVLRSAVNYPAAEAVVSALALSGAGLLFLNLTRPTAPRLVLVTAFFLLTLVAKALAAMATLDEMAAIAWLTPGAQWGCVAAMVILSVSVLLPARARSVIGFTVLLVLLALVNILPDNPYFADADNLWGRGRVMNIFGLAHALNLLWPYVALVYLLRRPYAAKAPGKP